MTDISKGSFYTFIPFKGNVIFVVLEEYQIDAESARTETLGWKPRYCINRLVQLL